MPLSSTQAVLLIEGSNARRAREALDAALEPYTDARIIALTTQSNYVTSFGKVTLIAVIEHD